MRSATWPRGSSPSPGPADARSGGWTDPEASERYVQPRRAPSQQAQRRAAVWTGASHRESISSSTTVRVTEQPAMSRERDAAVRPRAVCSWPSRAARSRRTMRHFPSAVFGDHRPGTYLGMRTQVGGKWSVPLGGGRGGRRRSLPRHECSPERRGCPHYRNCRGTSESAAKNRITASSPSEPRAARRRNSRPSADSFHSIASMAPAGGVPGLAVIAST